ncbi:MAG: formylglycine-generating enzyme family protein [Ignavibacteria bacterium]|nr:formylglycine-generating enzyme family protein [Ignavibacteria bacterium]
MDNKPFFIFIWCFVLLLFPLNVFAQTVSNIRVETKSGRVVITYDLDGTWGEKYDINLAARNNNGETVIPSVLAGDVLGVSPGKTKWIWWEPQLEGRVLAGWTTVTVTATPSISNSIRMEFVLVQPGTVQMGSVEGDADERRTHSVTISNPFYIGKHEVTQKQWRDLMGTNPSKYQGDNRPVENVSWDDAQEFIRKLNEKEGATNYRLPTEAEWECAARGGSRSEGFKYAGSSNVADVAVCRENSGGETKPVGSKRANELGIYDMSGNVWEWCSDWHGPYSGSAEADPKGSSSGSSRVLRGGSFSDDGYYCRVAYRSYGNPTIRYLNFGFRCVRD